MKKLHQLYKKKIPLPENPPKSTHNHQACNKNSFISIDLPQSPQLLISKTRAEHLLHVGFPTVSFDGVDNRVLHDVPKNVWVGPSPPPLHGSFATY